MAGVLDALASYVQNMLTEMAKEEVDMLLGVTREIEKMAVKLGDLKNFLADADRRNITDISVQAWVKDLRRAMYEATDILDLCRLKAMEKGPSQDMGCFNHPLLFCMRNPLHAHDIGRRIKNLNERLDGIKARSASFEFINLGSYEDRGRNMVSPRSATRETSWGLDESDLVGEKIEEDTRNLVKMLTQEYETNQEYRKIMVFAIVGVGGIGKTTLAQKIFNNEIIQQEFSKKLWLSVNQKPNETEILRRAITEAGGNHLATGNTKAALERALVEALRGHKILLIMDDVWDHRIWEGVLRTPLVNAIIAHGSRVLVTTRHDTIAQGMLAKKPYHRINKLGNEDAWLLLKKQVVGNGNNDEQQVNTLRDIGMGIIAKCDGLPLAVKVIGGLLRQRKILRIDWEKVLNDSIRSVPEMPDELNNSVYLSYQDLHSNLKPCFLHYALLPKSTVFRANNIVAMWISEGFVHGNSSCDLEVLGNEYYNQLIARNLIEPNQQYVDQKVCNMHDVVRSFAQYVARDEALMACGSETSLTDKHNSQNVIRLSLKAKKSESNEVAWSSLQAHISLRTLILVGQMKINPGDSLSSFSSLRVVHIEDGNFNELSESLVHLKHLRYLSIRGTDTSRLPENIEKIKFLEHIDLSSCEHLVKLPSGIGKLQQLRFLGLNGTKINNVSRGFGGLTNLRILLGFPAHVDGDWCSLEELGPLNQLMHLQVCGLENVSSSFGIKARLGEKVRLTYLCLNCTSGDGNDHRLVKEEEQQQIMNVFDELCPASCLEHLVINGYFGRQLPSWMTSTSIAPFVSLRILTMEDLPYCKELPNGLWQLPSLEFLQIRRARAIKHIGPEYLLQHRHENPRAMENIGSDLRIVLAQCPNLKRINNLPRLQNLAVARCLKLKALEGLPALQRLSLNDYGMKTLPRYLHGVNPRHLRIDCRLSLLTCIAAGKSSPEWGKFNHMQLLKAYARQKRSQRKWNVLFRRDPFRFKTNISRSAIHKARKARTWFPYSRTCPIGDEWPVGRHTSADKRLPLCCVSFRCNAYYRLVPWLRQTCLHCTEVDGIASSSDQWMDAPRFPAGALFLTNGRLQRQKETQQV